MPLPASLCVPFSLSLHLPTGSETYSPDLPGWTRRRDTEVGVPVWAHVDTRTPTRHGGLGNSTRVHGRSRGRGEGSTGVRSGTGRDTESNETTTSYQTLTSRVVERRRTTDWRLTTDYRSQMFCKTHLTVTFPKPSKGKFTRT